MTLQKNGLAVRTFGMVMRLAAWLQALPARGMPPPVRLLQVGSAFWQSRALYAATRLDFAGVLGHEALPAHEIARRAGTSADATGRLLRMLASIGVFREARPGVFANNPVSALLRDGAAGSMRAMVLMHNSPEMTRPWVECLEAGVRDGKVPFRLAHGDELYGYMDRHREFDALFARAMESVEALAGESFARDFDWGRFRRVVDLGGGKGAKSVMLLRHHARLQALVVDREQVVSEGERAWAGREAPALLQRLAFAAGDVFGEVPPARDGDAYLLSAVLHGFDDAQSAAVLRKLCAACAGTDARIVVAEAVVPEGVPDAACAAFDMQMFMATRGRERTLAQWRELAREAGLALQEQVRLRSFPSLLVLAPAS